MLSAEDIRRMRKALDAVLKTCIRDCRSLQRKHAEYLRPDLEELDRVLLEAERKRERQ